MSQEYLDKLTLKPVTLAGMEKGKRYLIRHRNGEWMIVRLDLSSLTGERRVWVFALQHAVPTDRITEMWLLPDRPEE